MKIITHGKFGKELAAHYQNSELQIDYREHLDQTILDQYQAWAAFSPPPNLDISHIKWIHSFAAGVDPYLRRNDLNAELILTKSVGKMGRKMAEYCLNQILMSAQNSLPLFQKQLAQEWFRLPPQTIEAKSVAILGTGFMGKAISQLLGAVGMKIIGVNRSGQAAQQFPKTYSFEDFQQAPPAIAYLICTLPATKDNYHLLDNAFFSKFQALHFINCGRGRVVDISALLIALEKGNLSWASLDVFQQEPLSADSVLWKHPQITITPHQASLTSLEDVLESFQLARQAIITDQKSSLQVDLKRGY
ncbi:MAG: NAD(P)-dependent oxidoreductase [Candidatus Cloacimonadales bacterium]